MTATDSIESKSVSGEIPPDTVYRAHFVSLSGGICGLVLIDAVQFPEDASIRFNSSTTPPTFRTASNINADCFPGQITVVDMVTGQVHKTDSPGSLAEAETYTRNYIDLLLL